jgi:hypothetical protein
MQVTALRAAAFCLVVVLLAWASVQAQAQSAASSEARSPLSAIAAWLNHSAQPRVLPHRRGGPSMPLPRPRPAELTPAPAVSNKPAPVPIYD